MEKYEKVHQMTNQYLQKTRLKDGILQFIVWFGFLNGLNEEQITACVQSDGDHMIPYECRDYMRRALEYGADMETVSRMADMSPADAREHLSSILTAKEKEKIGALDKRIKALEKEKNVADGLLEKANAEISQLKKSIADEQEMRQRVTEEKADIARCGEALQIEILELKDQMEKTNKKHEEEVNNLVRERDGLLRGGKQNKTLFKSRAEKEAERKQKQEEKMKFFQLIVSGKFCTEQIAAFTRGLEDKIPLPVMFSLANPENDAEKIEQMIACYKKLPPDTK